MNKFRNILILSFIAFNLICSTKSIAIPRDQILEICQGLVEKGDYSDDIKNSLRCMDYIEGMQDGLAFLAIAPLVVCKDKMIPEREFWFRNFNYQQTLGICMPDTYDLSSFETKKINIQIIRVFYRYLVDNLNVTDKTVPELYFQAMRKEYPCQ